MIEEIKLEALSVPRIIAAMTVGGLFKQILLIVGFIFTYVVSLVIYRLYLSPLSKFPGPKLAAVTSLYAFYYDVTCNGKFIWEVEKMHKQYGPIVRIRPDVLHINDPNYIDQIYAGAGKRRHKYKIACNGFATPRAALGTADHNLHRSRRADLNPYFSKQSIRRLEPIIHDVLHKMLDRLEQHSKSGAIVKTTSLYNAVTSDIISNYAFGPGPNCMDREDLNAPFFTAYSEAGEGFHIACWLPFLPMIFTTLPQSVIVYIMPKIEVFLDLLRMLTAKLAEARESDDADAIPTIFHGLLNGSLPESEKSDDRMLDEARVILAAGTDTTAKTLSAATYHLLANPPILSKLKAELETALPDTYSLPAAAVVEKLPYLTAVIEETIRLHPGATIRQERVAPDEDLYYEGPEGKKYTIPRGTAVGMTAPLLSRLEEIYPSPYEFRPERYLENPRLDRYQLAFSRGTRRCIGINLAYQELYLVLAAVFRKYDRYDGTGKQKGPTLELFRTTREDDVDMASDIVSPMPKKGSPGVRLLVR